MNVLVCGGAGYIGSRLCIDLLRAGHKVTALDSFLYGQDHALLACCDDKNFEVHKVDCRDTLEITYHLKAAAVIYWLAAIVGSKTTENSAAEINVAPIRLIADWIHRSQLIIYPTTNAGFAAGTGARVETDPMEGKTWYSKSKIEAEKILMDTGRAVSFRLAAVYGLAPQMRWDGLVNSFVLEAVKKRNLIIYQPYAKRDVLHVRDASQALMMPLSDFRMSGQVYNVGETCVTKDFLCVEIRRFMMDLKWTYEEKQDPEGRDYEVSYQKIEDLGFKPTRNLRDSLPSLVKAALMHGDLLSVG